MPVAGAVGKAYPCWYWGVIYAGNQSQAQGRIDVHSTKASTMTKYGTSSANILKCEIFTLAVHPGIKHGALFIIRRP